jgi:MFS family permease
VSAVPEELEDPGHRVFYLLKLQRFLPLFCTQFLGAFNDNLFKNALIAILTYGVASQAGYDTTMLVVAAGGIFILPFFLFSATAGQLADRLDKASMVRWTKLWEIGVMIAGAFAFYTVNVPMLFLVLFLMGTQSAFFGPLKYGILPTHLKRSELVGGNALFEGATFMAILLGTIIGTQLVLTEAGTDIMAATVLCIALIGWLTSRYIPPVPSVTPDLKIDWFFPRSTWTIVGTAIRERSVFACILADAWFWYIGATIMALLPTFARDVLLVSDGVYTVFLAMFSIGIAAGSLLANRLLNGEVSPRYAPIAAVFMGLSTIGLALVAVPFAAQGELAGMAAFFGQPRGLLIAAFLISFAVFGGLYAVPIFALLQSRAAPERRARTIAADNIVVALGMVISAVVTQAAFAAGGTIPIVIGGVGAASILVALIVRKL